MSMIYVEGLPATANRRKRWSRDDCQFLENSGLLKGVYELIDGEIVIKMGQHRRHARVIAMLIKFLNAVYGAERVQAQATMEVREDDRVLNRPEPDAAVLREDIDYTPSGTDVLLAVEVSDTTQADDYGPKVGLYARAGVGEYWVIDLTRRVLVAFRWSQNGEWQTRQEFAEGEQIAPVSAPEAFVAIVDLLPPVHEQA